MKKQLIPLAFLLTAMFPSCEVLEVEPAQSISAETALTTVKGVQQALNGCYDALQFAGYYGRNYILAPELVSDNGLATGTIKEYKELANNSLLADNVVVEGIWNDIYTAINRTNNVIYYAPQVKDIQAAELNNILGQARFLRALHHFNLLRLFGPVPLKDQPSLNAGAALNTPRAPIAALYSFILDDLIFAESNITNTNPALATRLAATALMARIYLYQQDYENARLKATAVLAAPALKLETEYAALFEAGNNTETIFHAAFDEQDKNRLAEYFLPTSFGGRKEVSPSSTLLTAYEAGDARFPVSISSPASDPYGTKYTDISTGTDKVYILRLAEMYLIRAEAEARLNGNMVQIKADIDTLRQRAQLGNVVASSYADLILAIEKERRVEFAFEGHRWFDLVRTNRAMDLKPTVTQACQMLFPIPLSEIQTNDAIKPEDQNPCY